MRRILLTSTAIAVLSTTAFAHEVIHSDHAGHQHAVDCGHSMLEHDGHVDFLHDGHLHSAHEGHVDEHTLAISAAHPGAHELSKIVSTDDHMHGHEGEEHMTVQHGSHMDFIHDGRLHHVHGDHTDDHGAVRVMKGV